MKSGSPYYGNDPQDHVAIQKGIDMYTNYVITTYGRR
jgi:hypothetical protein